MDCVEGFRVAQRSRGCFTEELAGCSGEIPLGEPGILEESLADDSYPASTEAENGLFYSDLLVFCSSLMSGLAVSLGRIVLISSRGQLRCCSKLKTRALKIDRASSVNFWANWRFFLHGTQIQRDFP